MNLWDEVSIKIVKLCSNNNKIKNYKTKQKNIFSIILTFENIQNIIYVDIIK